MRQQIRNCILLFSGGLLSLAACIGPLPPLEFLPDGTPKIVSMSPEDGATNQSTLTTVRVTFDQRINAEANLNGKITMINIQSSEEIPLTISVQPEQPFTVQGVPDIWLETGTTYRFTAHPEVLSEDGLPSYQSATARFTTIAVK